LGIGLLNIVLFSPATFRSLTRFYDRYFVPFCMYCLIRLIAPTEKDMLRFLWIAFIALVGQCIGGMLSVFVPHVVPRNWINEQGQRTIGSLGNPAVYTSTLIFLNLLLFQYAMQGKSRWIRWLLIFTFSVTFFCVFLSFSRGSWLGGTLVLIGLMFVYPKVSSRIIITSLIVMIVLGSTILADQIAFAIVRLNTYSTAEGRIVGGAKSVQMIASKPWTGWGYDTYDTYDEKFKVSVANIAAKEDAQTSHNTYLTVMAELGVPALLLVLFPAGWWLLLSKKVWQRLPKSGFQSWHLLAMLWLLMLDHFTVSNFMDMYRFNLFGTTVWWLALGLIANLVYPYLRPSDFGLPRWALSAQGRLSQAKTAR
jgi:O-antigen ligase